jgi:hypothetical protein
MNHNFAVKVERRKAMDKKEKIEKKRIISEFIDLEKSRYKDDEVDTLYNIVTNREKFNGLTRTIKNAFSDWSSDGKYTRKEETTYTFKSNDDGVSVEKSYQYHDDDGQSDKWNGSFNTGRVILNVFNSFFKN